MSDFRFGVRIQVTDSTDLFIETVELAEKLGFDTVWVPDARLHFDHYTTLALAAIHTSRMRVGSSITNPYTRHPALTAAGIASVDMLSGGRAVLGMGAGGAVLKMLQIKDRHPATDCRRAVRQIRGYLDPDSDSPAHLDFPCRPDLPIFLAGGGPYMLRLAGEMGDGVIVNVGVEMGCVKKALAMVQEGTDAAPRREEIPERLAWLHGCVLDEDPARALHEVRTTAARYINNCPNWALQDAGLDLVRVEELRRTVSEQGLRQAAELVTEEMARKFTLCGTPAMVVEKLLEFRSLGFEEMMFNLEHFGGDVREPIRALAQEVMAPIRGL